MINYKIKNSLTGEESWPGVSSVFVKGISGQTEVADKKLEEKNEKVIQSWKNIAVMRATGEKETEFYIGFYNMEIMQYLHYEFRTNLDFAMRIGPGDVRFFILPKNLDKKIDLELIEITSEDDKKYKDLVLI